MDAGQAFTRSKYDYAGPCPFFPSSPDLKDLIGETTYEREQKSLQTRIVIVPARTVRTEVAMNPSSKSSSGREKVGCGICGQFLFAEVCGWCCLWSVARTSFLANVHK